MIKHKISKISNYMFFSAIILILVCIPVFFVSCKKSNPIKIKLFNTETKSLETINLENYIEGVVAGEIQNNAPIETLKAQAILARTFTMNFLQNNKSKYENADISTDITEAQAYNPLYINDNIRKAVNETKGKVLKHNNEYINALFHSNSGGYTSDPNEGLNILNENYPYIKSIKTNETTSNTKNFKWTATFSKSEVLNALRNMGVSISNITTFTKGEIGNSGRCITFKIAGKEVNANTFRISIGSTKLKSTLIDKITVSNSNISFSGQGYGHGVGLSQEYSVVLANEGKNYKDIINFFYKDIEIKDI